MAETMRINPKLKLVNIRELSALTGDSVRTVWRRIADGELPTPFRRGNRAVWRECDLERYFAKAAGAAKED